NFYQALNFRLSAEGLPNFYVGSHLQVAKIGEDDWSERVYNMFADWRSASRQYQIRLGRQFVYEGTINGTMDGLLLSASPFRRLTVKVFAGLESPLNRDLKIVETDSTAVGAYLSYRMPFDAKVEVSYFQRERTSGTIWQLVGGALTGKIGQGLYYQAQVDHNLLSEELQGMRYRLTYYKEKWGLNAEYSQQEPRLLEDSFFRLFQIDAYQQYRGGVTYQLDENYLFGMQYIFTDYALDQGNQIVLNGANQFGSVGVVFQDGYAGNNVGLYGEINYDLMQNLTLRLYGSRYTYELQTTDISEEATAFSGGLIYRPFKPLALQAEVQQSINSDADKDVRGLFRLNYAFRR
nr:hypothetical protein [Calditrichia bacterium]